MCLKIYVGKSCVNTLKDRRLGANSMPSNEHEMIKKENLRDCFAPIIGLRHPSSHEHIVLLSPTAFPFRDLE